MAYAKMELDALLRKSEGAKVLFLGKEGVFTKAETERYLKRYGIARTENFETGVVGVIEHHRLNPVEEDISSLAYEQNIPRYKLAEFEKLLSENIDDDQLLMGIKLSNDQERIFRLIKNEHLNDALFVKLLDMYCWHHDDEDNTQDREVIMATLRRYIKIKPNEEDLLYSPLTLNRLSREATDPGLLYALIGFQNISFLQKGKQKITLHETIAANRHIDQTVVSRLLSLRDEGVDMYLACNESLDPALLQKFAQRDSRAINEALASNSNIDDAMFFSLLGKTSDTVKLLLWYQPITMQRYLWIKENVTDKVLLVSLGDNKHIAQEVLQTLQEDENNALLERLCINNTVPPLVLKTIFERKIPQLYPFLAKNISTPVCILEELYEKQGENVEILKSLASNASTPQKILYSLYERDQFEINEALASNPSTPLEFLNIFKIDTRLRNALTANETFVASITQSLGL